MINFANQRDQDAANKGYSKPNTQSMSQAQAQQVQKAFNDQKAKNDANKK